MRRFINEIKSYIIIIVVVVLLRTFIITPGLVKGSSMENTLFNKDLVLVIKISLKRGIERFDIVVVSYNGETLIKRVIGLPNETVKYENDNLYIDDKKIDTSIKFETTNDFELTSGKDEYIILGDNRDVSKDSRVIGPVNKDDIKGKVNFIIFPFKRFGYIK